MLYPVYNCGLSMYNVNDSLLFTPLLVLLLNTEHLCGLHSHHYGSWVYFEPADGAIHFGLKSGLPNANNGGSSAL